MFEIYLISGEYIFVFEYNTVGGDMIEHVNAILKVWMAYFNTPLFESKRTTKITARNVIEYLSLLRKVVWWIYQKFDLNNLSETCKSSLFTHFTEDDDRCNKCV